MVVGSSVMVEDEVEDAEVIADAVPASGVAVSAFVVVDADPLTVD